MSCELLHGDKVISLSLDVDPASHTCILRGELINEDGNPAEDSINLNGFIENIDGNQSQQILSNLSPHAN